MPRPKNSLLHDQFNFNNSDKLICNNGNCNGKILNTHSGNLERHLRKYHPEKYLEYLNHKTDSKTESNKITKTKLFKEENKKKIELAIVELFTKNGRPLHMSDDRAFKVLVQPAFNLLNINVNEHNITERIISFSNMLKAGIVADLKGKLVSLKIDAATRQDVSILGINLQYVRDKAIIIKTLAIRQLQSSHTSEYLKSIVLEVLQEYSIDLSQILTITTGNGKNMLAVEEINNVLQHSLEAEQMQDDLTAESLESLRNKFASYGVTSVRCGAHTLHLCVQDVLRKEEIKQKIDKCRAVAKKLNTHTYLNILKTARYKKPTVDCCIKWNSTFNMLERLLEIREIIDSLSSANEDLLISTDIWIFVDKFITTFRPVYIATIKLQSEQLCFSELYAIIMDIIIQTEYAPSSEMTTLLAAALNKRKDKLFHNEIFNASVFLDPRTKVCLDSDQVLRAEKYIASLHQRIICLKETMTTSTDILGQSVKEEINEPSTSEAPIPKTFSEYLRKLDPVPIKLPISPLLTHLETYISMYKRQPRCPTTANVLDFWDSQTSSLSVIANVVLAVPATQISVERLFSSLEYILNDRRSRLSPNLEHILFVKANGEFRYEN